MGHHRFYSRALFVAIWTLLLTLVSIGLFVSPTGSMPEMRETPETITEPILHIIPQEVAVNVSDTFSVLILAHHVEDMYGWEIRLRFNPAIVEGLNVSTVEHHAFSELYTVSEALMDYNITQFTMTPLQIIKNDEGYVMAGECLLGQSQPTFTGSALLCQVNFKAISPGYSKLELCRDNTYFLNSKIEGIGFTLFSSRIIVHSTEDPSIAIASMCIVACLGVSLLPLGRKDGMSKRTLHCERRKYE